MPVPARKQSVGDRAPLHVPPLRATERDNAVLGEDIETERVNTLLIDDNEVLWLLVRVNGLVAYKPLELDDLPTLLICESTF